MQWISLLQSSQAFFLSCTAVLGLIIGSFLNVVILRLPKMLKQEWSLQCQMFIQEAQESASIDAVTKISTPEPAFNLMTPSSQCPCCGHQLSALENIPVFSFLVLKGRCRSCQKPISWRYPIIEIMTACFSVLIAYHFHFSFLTLYALVFTWSLITLTMIDLEHLLLPDDITLPVLWLGLLLNMQGTFTSLSNAVLGAVLGYLFLWSIYWLFKLMTRKEGMGYGDFKLLAMLGAWLGWHALPSIVLIGSLSGAIVGVLLILFKQHHRATPIPFGPFLAAGGWITLLWGDKITQLYLQYAHLT